MSIKEIKEAIDEKKVYFGIKQAKKHKANIATVFVTKDARDETIKLLEDAKIEFVVLKPKSEMTKGLNLDFESEVFSIKK
jgi:ribosomal protein L7Ae-like RNA K-turn-binding protein